MPSMRGSTGRSGRRMKNEINVVPYIDVMLVLLVIFMVTAPMITPGLIELPSVGQASDVPAKPVEIQVDKDGKVAIRLREPGSEFMDIEKSTLLNEVRSRLQPDSPVVIAADGKVPYETVMELMDELRSNGITRLGLLVDQNTDTSDRK
ncbi:MAG TPA: protein TolR [Alcaligenes sp.]|nr:protein TolR [Alcaligenes sp.]HRL26840.1 protein TolR [Alcaligenes sp.]